MRVEFNFDPGGGSAREEPSSVPDSSEMAPAAVVSEKARQLALAYHIHSLVDSGEVKDIASIADAAGISRARVSQILDLTLLAPSIQEGILDGSLSMGSHALRELSTIRYWPEQEEWIVNHQGILAQRMNIPRCGG
ncbi:MAG: hypothetical protein KOO63_03595 [Bacteroidales bacterium]|nr:hypothetical protein [Candidatus Latescibacterota bacterium]